MKPEHAFLLLLNLCDTWSFHLLCYVLVAICCSQLYHHSSAIFGSFLLQFMLSFAFPAEQQIDEVYSRFLHINRSFYIKINQKNGLKIDVF